MDEIAQRAQMDVDEVRRVMDIGRHPVSLDRPVGEGDDCSFGEFIEDSASDNPVRLATNGILRDKIEQLLKTLTYREREIVRLRYGLSDGYNYTLEEVGRTLRSRVSESVRSKPKPFASCRIRFGLSSWRASCPPTRFRTMTWVTILGPIVIWSLRRQPQPVIWPPHKRVSRSKAVGLENTQTLRD